MTNCTDGSVGAGLANPVALAGRKPPLSASPFSADNKVTPMRICSFLPSATEIVCAVGPSVEFQPRPFGYSTVMVTL